MGVATGEMGQKTSLMGEIPLCRSVQLEKLWRLHTGVITQNGVVAPYLWGASQPCLIYPAPGGALQQFSLPEPRECEGQDDGSSQRAYHHVAERGARIRVHPHGQTGESGGKRERQNKPENRDSRG